MDLYADVGVKNTHISAQGKAHYPVGNTHRVRGGGVGSVCMIEEKKIPHLFWVIKKKKRHGENSQKWAGVKIWV